MRLNRILPPLLLLSVLRPGAAATAPVTATTDTALEGKSCSSSLSPVNMIAFDAATGKKLRCKAGLWAADDIPPCAPDPPTGACTSDAVCQSKAGAGITLYGCDGGSWFVIGGAGGTAGGSSQDVQVNVSGAFAAVPGFTANDSTGAVETAAINGERIARKVAGISGAGTSGSPFTGWAGVITAGKGRVLFTGNADGTTAYYDVPDAGITVPSDIEIAGDGNAVLTWGTARASVNPMFLLAPGTSNVDIHGLRFEPGVSVPANGGMVDGTGGASYLRIGNATSATPVVDVRVHHNDFGIMRGSAGSSVHITVMGSSTNLSVTDNTFDHGGDVFDLPCGNATYQLVVKDTTFARNKVLFSQVDNSNGYVVQAAVACEDATGLLLTKIENLAITDNTFENVNGGIEVKGDVDTVNISGNTIRSDYLDFCAIVRMPTNTTKRVKGVTITGNTCVADSTPYNGVACSTGVCNPTIKIASALGGVISGNTVYGDPNFAIVDVSASTGVTVSGNTIDVDASAPASGGAGCVLVFNSSGVTVDGNTCVNPEGYGFRVTASAYTPSAVKISNNLILDTNATASTYFATYIDTACNGCAITSNLYQGLSAPSSGFYFSGSPSQSSGNAAYVGATLASTPTFTGRLSGPLTIANEPLVSHVASGANVTTYNSDGIDVEGTAGPTSPNWRLHFPDAATTSKDVYFGDRSGFVALQNGETQTDGCATYVSGVLNSTGIGCGSSTGGTLSATGTPTANQLAIWNDATHLRGQTTATCDSSGNCIFATVQALDPGNTARRLDLIGNTSDLAGAALPSGASPSHVAFYGMGTQGNELPYFRNAAVGLYSLLTNRTAAGGDLTGLYPNPTLANSGATPGAYDMPTVTFDAKGRATAVTDGKAATYTLTNKTISGGDASSSGTGTTRSAGSNIIGTRTHNTDCTQLADGKKGEQCVDLDDGRIWICVPAAGDCDTVGEWKRVDASGGSGLASMVVHENYPSPTAALDKVILYATQAINIDSVRAALTGTTSETWDLVYARTANEATTLGQVFGTDTVTSSAAGVSVSPGSPVIPSGAYLRVKGSAVSGTPSNLFVQLAYSAATGAQCNDGTDNDSANGIDYPEDPGCSSATDTTESSADTTAPEAIANLNDANPTATTCDLSWTAPHEDGASGGNVASYECRVRAGTTFLEADWAGATGLTGEPTPGTAGVSTDSFTATIPSATPSTAYAFACKSSDEVPNVSSISNATSCTTSAVSNTLHITFWAGFENGSNGDTSYVLGSNDCAMSGAIDSTTLTRSGSNTTIASAAALVGSLGVNSTSTGGGANAMFEANLSAGTTMISGTDGKLGFLFNYTGTLDSNKQLVYIQTTGTGTAVGTIEVRAYSGSLFARYTSTSGGQTADCSGTGLSAGTTYYAEYLWYSGQTTLTVYNASSGSEVVTCNGGSFLTAIDVPSSTTDSVLNIGYLNSSTASTVYIDNVMIGTDHTADFLSHRNDTTKPSGACN